MAKDAIVSEDLAKKFATEKDSPYVRWVRGEGLDIISAHYVPDLNTVELKDWARRGGPALGDTVVGAAAGALGPVAALTVGGLLAAVYAGCFIVRPNPVRAYRGVGQEEDAAVPT